MTKDLLGAIAEENLYLAERRQGIDTSLPVRLSQYGYDNLDKYFIDKKQYLFSKWSPDVIYYDVTVAPQYMEDAIVNTKYGIYMLESSGIYAFHGNGGIDLDLCKQLNVIPANMGYNGGIIIGSNEDLAIEILMPTEIDMHGHEILAKFAEIMRKYMSNVVVDGNDILVDGKKVLGSIERHFRDVYVWAAQVSFADYTEYIPKLCNKISLKRPGYIDKNKLSKEQLKTEVVQWLQKR